MENMMIDLSKVIGVYTLCNVGAVLVHKIDYGEDRVLASINGQGARWCSLTEQYMETSGEPELGFCLDGLFVPFCEVMRFYGGTA